MNIDVAAMPGLAIGMITRSNVRHSPAPSTRAASRYSSGIVTMNCRSRKMENASPSRFGRISGHSVPVRWKLAHQRYSGTVVICGGNSIMQMITRNTKLRPRHFSFDSAYAAGTLEINMKPVARIAYSSVLSR